MKKLMKKKISLLGKEFSVFALVMVMMMTFASASLVGYLSNNVSADATIESPFLVEMATVDINGVLDDFSKQPTTFIGPGFGGSTFETRARIENLLGRDVGNSERTDLEAEVVITISATGDIVAGEITELRFKDLYPEVDENSAVWQPLDTATLSGLLDANGDIVIRLPMFFHENQVSEYPIEMDVALNAAPTTYTVKIGVGMIGRTDSYKA